MLKQATKQACKQAREQAKENRMKVMLQYLRTLSCIFEWFCFVGFFCILFLFRTFSVISNLMLYLNVLLYKKARYTIMPLACGWEGAVIEKVTWAFGQE